MSTAKGRMGGSYGRLGGQLSGASRARAALRNTQPVRVVTEPLGSRKEGSTRQQATHMFDANSVAALAQALAFEQTQMLTEKVAALEAKLALQQQPQQQLTLSLSAATASSSRAARSARRSSAPEAAQIRTDAGAQAQPATEPPRARAASAPPRVRGNSEADKAALAGVRRGQNVIVKPRAGYRKYTLEDVCELGQLIKDRKLTLRGLNARDKNGQPKYKVPRSTMQDWVKRDRDGVPKWHVERDCRRRHSLPKPGGTSGGSTVLGEVTERKLMTVALNVVSHLRMWSPHVMRTGLSAATGATTNSAIDIFDHDRFHRCA